MGEEEFTAKAQRPRRGAKFLGRSSGAWEMRRISATATIHVASGVGAKYRGGNRQNQSDYEHLF
jgi:hypothetical protein